jgi:NhaA family Na+:H+ antiporter
LTAGAFLAGIGFTMSIFIANLAFERDLLGAAKLGILMGSAVSAIIGLLALLWLVTSSDLRRSGKDGEV